VRKTLTFLIGVILFMSTTQAKDALPTYILHTGEPAAKRLNVQGNILQEKSEKHLQRAGLKPGQVVYDVGCGNGIMTNYMASVVGEAGHVYAVDSSAEQLALAKQRIDNAGYQNVTYIKTDVATEGIPKAEEADIVYARLFLMHLKDPSSAVAQMRALLKPTGVLALQEPINSTNQVTDDPNYFQVFVKGLLKTGDILGLDYDIGLRLHSLVEANGFSRIEQTEHQDELQADEARGLITMVHQEWGKKALDLGALTPLEYDQIGEDIKNLHKPFMFAKHIQLIAYR
jgi:SAM-dependent methyltransferase